MKGKESRIVLALLLVLVAFSVFASASFLEKDKVYFVGEEVRLDFSEYSNYILRIKTPYGVFLKEGSEDVFRFSLNEKGNYSFDVDWDLGSEVHNIAVFLDNDDYKRQTNVQDENSHSESHFEEDFSDFNNSIDTERVEVIKVANESRYIRVGEPVLNYERIVIDELSSVIKIPFVAENVTAKKDGKDVLIKENIKVGTRLMSLFSESNLQKEIMVESENGEIELEYYTPAPTKVEKKINSKKKEIVVSAPDYLGYENVFVSVDGSDILKQEGNLKVYWKEENRYMDYYIDESTNEINFVVPHLSTQTFEIIVITNAEHLDSNREFLKNVYSEVSEIDDKGVQISENEYLRVVFERMLDSSKDITIYASSKNGGIVDVYRRDSNEKIVSFGVISGYAEYKVYLKNLNELEDTFDLRVVSGDVYFDYAVDPIQYFTETFTSLQSGTWVVPNGVGMIMVEAWGGGGAGGGSTSNGRGGSGGAGGQYSRANISVVPGQQLTISVAAGVSGGTGSGATGNPTYLSEGATTYVRANGGAGGLGATGGTTLGGSGSVAGGIGDVVYSGGNGGNGASTSGGGGGGAGSTGNGGSASGTTAGIGTSELGGNGGVGLSSGSANGNSGQIYGGGGSGARRQGGGQRSGGNGAAGYMRITYGVSNEPTISNLVLNSTDGTNRPSQDLNCVARVTDPDNDPIDIQLSWYKNGALNRTIDYNNGYSSGTDVHFVLDKSETSDGDIWMCSMRGFDGNDYGVWVNSSELLVQDLFVDYTWQTCSGFWGFDCGVHPDADNTWDSCSSSAGGSADEHVDEIYMNGTAFESGESIMVTCEFDPYSTGTEEYIYLYDGSSWVQLYSGSAPSGNVHNVSAVFSAPEEIGGYWVRCIADWDGENDECASGSYYDNDDLRFSVVPKNNPPTIPTSITCNGGSCDIEVTSNVDLQCLGSSDSDYDDITYFIEAYVSQDNTYSENSFVNLFAMGEQNFDYSTRTCDDTWGFNCGSKPDADNTWDSCPTYGSIVDESIDSITINLTTAKFGDVVNVDCAIDPYGTQNEIYMWYYNGTGWKTIYSGNAPSGTNFNLVRQIPVDSVIGTHWVRCGIGYDADDVSDFCVNAGNYFDNDDISFFVEDGTMPSSNKNYSLEYFNFAENQAEVNDITLVVEVSGYSPLASVNHGNDRPDLFIEIFDGNSFVPVGFLNLPVFFGENKIYNEVRNFTLTITDADVLNSWKTLDNQDLRIIGVNMDYEDSLTIDYVNYSSVYVSMGSYSWILVGSHSEGSSFSWDTLSVKSQLDVGLRCEAIDLMGSASSLGFYVGPSLLDIVHDDIFPPQIELISPLDEAVNTTSGKPAFKFNATDDSEQYLGCQVLVEGPTSGIIASNSNVSSGVETELVSTYSLIDGDYNWFVRCNDGKNVGESEKRKISIFASANNKAFVQAESGRVYAAGTTIAVANLNNRYQVNRTFIIADSQIAATSTTSAPANSDAIFYFSNINSGYSNELTVERSGTGDTLLGTYSLLESEYIDVCHVSGILGNGIDLTNVDISSECSFVPENYNDKCFVSVRNNVKLSSTSPNCRAEGYVMGKLTSNTNLALQAHTRACGDRDVRADVVCFKDETNVNPISTGEIHFDTGVDFSIGKQVNMSNSFLMYSCRSEELGLEDMNVQCKFKDDSTITCLTSELGTGGSAPQECEIYVVEFPENSYSSVIHHVPTDLEVGDKSSFTTSFSPAVVLNESALFCGYSFRDGEGTAHYRGEYPAYFLNESVIEFERGNTGNSDPSHNINCEIISFPTRKDPINVQLISPSDNYRENDLDFVDLSFSAQVVSESNLKSCELWHNATGSWHMNQSKLVGGRNTLVEFMVNDLSEVFFRWNIRCENIRDELAFSKADRVVEIKKISAANLTLVSPSGTIVGAPLEIEVSSDMDLLSCNYSLNDGVSFEMTELNLTYFSASEDYVRNGENKIDVSCVSLSGRESTVSRNFNFISDAVVNIRHGSTTILDGVSQLSVPVFTENLANSFLLFSVRSSASTPAQIHVQGILNKNNIVFNRYSTTGDVEIEWQIIESPNIFVQRGLLPIQSSQTSVNLDIGIFDLSKSFIVHSGMLNSGNTAQNVNGFFANSFMDSDTINFVRSQPGVSGEISWQVIEWNGAMVQSGSQTFSGTTSTKNLNENIDLNKTFLIMSNTFGTGDDSLSETAVQGILNEGSIDFFRSSAGGDALVSYFLVSSNEFNLQRGDYSLSGGNPVNVGINQVNSSKAFVLESHSSSGTGTTFANRLFTTQLIDDNNIQFWKGSNSQTQQVGWQVVEIGVPLSSFIILDVPQDGYYSSSSLNFSISTKLSATGCEYSLDSGSRMPMNMITTTSYDSEIFGLSAGNHTAIFYCRDSSNNEYASETINFNIDLESPNVILDLPINGYESSSNAVDFSFVATDNNGISECSIVLDEEFIGSSNEILNNTVKTINAYVPNGVHDWSVVCTDFSGRSVESLKREIVVSGPENYPWTNRFYETSTSNFNQVVAETNLLNERDFIENSLSYSLPALTYRDLVVSKTPYVGNNGLLIPSGETVSFSSYFDSDMSNVVYLTWKVYIENSTGDYLICKSGDDYLNGTRISSLSGTWTSSCVTSSDVVLKNSDKIKYVISAYNDGISSANLVHRWDGLKLSFVEFSNMKIIGLLETEFVDPMSNLVLREGDYRDFTCEVSCSIGECSNVRTTLQYQLENGSWQNIHNNNENLIFDSGVEWNNLGTVNQGSVNTSFLMYAVSKSNQVLRCFSEYDYGKARGRINPVVDIIKVPRVEFVWPTPEHLVELAQDFIPINITINETDLLNVVMNFNGVNETLFNSSLVLGYNLDKEEFRGENETRVESFTGGIGGTIYGAEYVEGYEGLALQFDGVSDYIETDSSLAPVLGSTSSLSFWVKTTQVGDDTNWMAPGVAGIEQSGGTNDIFIGWLDSSGRIGYTVANVNAAKSTIPINDGTWKHIVFSRDSALGNVKIYIDGELDQDITDGSLQGDVTLDFYSFGRIEDTGGTPEYFEGAFDKFVVYDRVLTDLEARDLYDGQRTFFVNKTGLINDNYEITIYAENYYGGMRDISRTIAIKYGDTIDPTMTIFGIENNSYYSSGNFYFEIYLDEYGQDCEYVLNYGSPVFMNKINNTYFDGNLNLVSDGEYILEFYCRDSSNNQAEAVYNFILDSVAPVLDFGILTPENLANHGPDNLAIDIDLTDANLKDLIFNWNGTNYTIIDSSLVGLIGFDNLVSFSENGNNIYDYVSGSHGNVYGATWLDRTGHDGKGSFRFIRSESDYIKMNPPYDFTSGNITFLSWVRTDSNVGEQVIFSLDDSVGNPLLSLGHSTDSNYLAFADAYGWQQTNSILTDGNWHQIGMIFYPGENVSIVFDGEIVSTFNTSTILPEDLQFNIGAGLNGVTPSYFFDGYIDSIEIYSKPLAEFEILNRKNFDFYKLDSENYYSVFEMNSLEFGDYTYLAYASDYSGFFSAAGLRTITIKDIDASAPTINLNLPLDDGVSSSSLVNFNWTVVDNLDSTLICDLHVGESVYSGINSNNGSLTNYLVSDLTDGSRYWWVECSDLDSNIGNSSVRIIAIAEPPTIVLNNENNSWLLDNFIRYTPSDNTNLSSCTLIVNESVFDTIGFISNNVENVFDVVSLNEGYFSYSVQCTDVYSLTKESEKRYFYNDKTEPTVNIWTPLNDTSVFDANINFTFSFEDNLASEGFCNLSIDSVVVEENLIVNESQNYSLSRIVSSGIHSWNVSCSDLSGNVGVSETFVFENYDAPQISLDSPENNSWVNSTDVVFGYNVFDNNGIDNCSLYVDGVYNQVDTSVENGLLNYFSSTLTEDNHNWSVVCYNTLGLVGYSEVYYLSIDSVSPTLDVHSPVGDEIFDWNDVLFNFTYNDNLDSNGTCEIVIDGFTELEIGAVWGVSTQAVVSRSDGSYNWKIRCRDDAGNVVESEEKSFSVVAPPVVDLISPVADVWSVNSSWNFTYIPRDATGLVQCGLYLDSVSIKNETTILKNEENVFEINGVLEGLHNWSVECIDADLNIQMSPIRSFGRDITSPTISLGDPEDGANIDANILAVPFYFTVDDNLGSTAICDLYIDSTARKSELYIQTGIERRETVAGISLGSHAWHVECRDFAGNSNSSEVRNFNYAMPDFVVSEIALNNTTPTEGDSIFINATIENIGGADSKDVLVEFFNGHPLSGVKLGEERINITSGETVFVSEEIIVDIGRSDIYVIVDSQDSFLEIDEENNILSYNISVGAWQYFYGKINPLSKFSLASEDGAIAVWNASDFVSGNVFMSDKDSSIDWSSLTAIGKTRLGAESYSDFSVVDSELGMTGLVDSVSSVYLNLGIPKELNDYFVFGKVVQGVSDARSINSENFKTGILWDSSDDTNGVYDSVDREDLVFVTKISRDTVGTYGTYDYEMRVPAKLREYSAVGSEAVFYVELQ